MTNPNPYNPPSAVARHPTTRNGVLSAILAVVLVNVALNAFNAVRNFPVLTVAHHVVGAALWLALPLWAVLLIWRGRSAGRWILVGLFGLRGIAQVIWLAVAIWPFLMRDPLVLVGPFRSNLMDAAFYCGATLWFLCSRRVREVSRTNALIDDWSDVEQSGATH